MKLLLACLLRREYEWYIIFYKLLKKKKKKTGISLSIPNLLPRIKDHNNNKNNRSFLIAQRKDKQGAIFSRNKEKTTEQKKKKIPFPISWHFGFNFSKSNPKNPVKLFTVSLFSFYITSQGQQRKKKN